MKNLNMSRISPKLIDVENNRVGYVDEDDYNKNVKKQLSFKNSKDGIFFGDNFGNNKQWVSEIGRFPTQLFTNVNTENNFKYVKYIT